MNYSARQLSLFLLSTFTYLSIVTCFSTNALFAQDWPQWMGPEQSGVWQATDTVDEFPEGGPPVLWRQKIGSGYAGPAVVGNRLFVMDRTKDDGKGVAAENNVKKEGIPGGERVQCLDTKTGESVWSHTYDCPYKIAYPTGPRCTPTVDGDHVYTLGAMGDLICFKSSDGEIVWQKDIAETYSTKPPLWGFASHPFIDGENLIVPVGGEGSGVVALDKNTGDEVWKSVSTFDIGYAPLVIYEPNGKERQLIFWHGAGVTSLDPGSGKEYWNVKFPNEKNASVVTIAKPQLSGNQLFIAEFYKGAMLLEIGSEPPSVDEKWRSSEIDPRNRTSMNCMMATPFLKDGFAYGVAYDARGNGVFRCNKVETGEEVWTESKWMGGEKPVMFANAFVVANGDKYFVFNDIGELMICGLSPDGFDERGRAKLLEPTSVARGRKVVWSHPAFAGQQMYARNDEEIICVDLSR